MQPATFKSNLWPSFLLRPNVTVIFWELKELKRGSLTKIVQTKVESWIKSNIKTQIITKILTIFSSQLIKYRNQKLYDLPLSNWLNINIKIKIKIKTKTYTTEYQNQQNLTPNQIPKQKPKPVLSSNFFLQTSHSNQINIIIKIKIYVNFTFSQDL